MRKALFFLLFTIFTIYCLLFTIKVHALSPTPISSPSAVEGTINEKVKEIREAVKEKVREKIQETKRGLPRAYVGEIMEINNSVLTLNTRHGELNVNLSSETKIIGKGGKKLEVKDLKIGNFCIAIGYLNETGGLEAKRLVIIEKPKLPAREVAFGRVTDISPEEKILTVKNEKKGITYTVEVTDKTIITKKVDDKVEKVKFSAIEIDDRIVAIGIPTENEKKLITAKIIHIIPGKAKGQEKPTPTFAASPTPEE